MVRDRFEYMIAHDMGIEKLNDMGSLGWELVSVVNFAAERIERFYFKRLLKTK